MLATDPFADFQCPRPSGPPDHDALVAREDWMRLMGLAEEEIADISQWTCEDLADELASLFAAMELDEKRMSYLEVARELRRTAP